MIQNYRKITKVLATSLGITTEELVRSYDRATRADMADVCELMRLGFGEVDNISPEIIAWRYFNFSKNSSDIYVLRYHGALIGAIGAEPITVKVGETTYEGIRAGDIVVHPEHGKRGIGAWMNLHLQYSFPVVMAMGSNDNSDTMVRRLFQPMRCRNHFKMLFSIKNYLAIRGWPSVYISLLSPIARLCWSLSRKFRLVAIPEAYALTEHQSTQQLACFFNNPDYKPRANNIALRSAEYCHWRYDLNPKSGFSVLELNQAGCLIGYAIVKKEGAKALADFQLMDWDLLPEYRNEKHLRILFSAAVNFSIEHGAKSLCVMTSETMSSNALQQTGFSHRALDDGFFLYANTDITREILNEKNWFLSLCDTDEAL